jgi:hypothetical protein
LLRSAYPLFRRLQLTEVAPPPASPAVHVPGLPPRRLVALLQTAMAAQVARGSRGAPPPPGLAVHTCVLGDDPPVFCMRLTCVASLLRDYAPRVLPTALRTVLEGHAGSVKSLVFTSAAGGAVAAGASDGSVRVRAVPLPVCLTSPSRSFNGV